VTLELGYAVGRNKRSFVLIPDGAPIGDRWKPELMHSFADRICVSEGELRAVLLGKTLSGACW
jgi:hypothetical protein